MKTKYPISKEFFPFNHFTSPVSVRMVRLAQKYMKAPSFIWKDSVLKTEMRKIPAWQGGEMDMYLFTPKGQTEPLPCLINYHGGGFVFEGWSSHFKMAMRYAKDVNCKVLYVRYRLAPDHPFPVPQEDCYTALNWIYDHAEELKIDPARIGIYGDSAGGALTVISCMLARDRGAKVKPLFQLLTYPWLDDRNCSDSYQRYTDTPMWNSSLSANVEPLINPHPETIPLMMHSPVEAESFEGLPPAYIEVAEFDSLHDDGILYAKLLEEAGIPVELHETKGTMHGFDTKINAPTTQQMLAKRIAFMKKMLDL